MTVGALLTVPGNAKEYSAVATVFAGALQAVVRGDVSYSPHDMAMLIVNNMALLLLLLLLLLLRVVILIVDCHFIIIATVVSIVSASVVLCRSWPRSMSPIRF